VSWYQSGCAIVAITAEALAALGLAACVAAIAAAYLADYGAGALNNLFREMNDMKST
jgi:hypothetical protein